jgi:predicted RNA binding protein YcfA (HicA-like mRNA interferase family)
MASEKPFKEARKMLEGKGYSLSRINGSHHVFTKPGKRPFSVPVHNGKVKPHYINAIKDLEN